MVGSTQTHKTSLGERYAEHTDKYFLRSKQILEAENVNPLVRYQVFVRKDIDHLCGVDEATDFIQEVAGGAAKIYSLREGQSYEGGQPIMKIEGRAQDLVDLETVYLEILSGNLTGHISMREVRKNARAVVSAAQEKLVYYFGARHFSPHLDEKISGICQEEGFAGCSTDIGAKAWASEGIGTIPHALILSYAAHMQNYGIEGNPTVEATKAFDRNIDPSVPRIALIDTFNEEIRDSLRTARAVPSLRGVRVDTCGENYSELTNNMKLADLGLNEKYLDCKGVSIAGVWALRNALDLTDFSDLEITVSSGFNAEKTTAFMGADRLYQEAHGKSLFDSIGTGSLAKPVMATSDIVAYFNEESGLWLPLSKKGRPEKFNGKLEEVR